MESRFYEPPRETKIGSKNRRVREIAGLNYSVGLRGGTTFSSSYREACETEGSRNRNSTVHNFRQDSVKTSLATLLIVVTSIPTVSSIPNFTVQV